MSGTIWLRVGGFPATEIAAHSAPTWETLADGGCGEASWAFALSPRTQHQALQTGALVEIMCGPIPVYAGQLTEVDRSTWECSASGLAAQAEDFLALGGDSLATREIGTAAAQATLAGWLGTNPTNISSTVSGEPGAPDTLAGLITQHARATGNRWGVDASRALFFRPDPTAPDWIASPDAAVFGRTDEGSATFLYCLYVNIATGNTEVVLAGTRGHDENVDITNLGEITTAEAQEILAGMLERDYAPTRWVNGTDLTSAQIQTMGGTPAFLPAVRGGQMMRAHGLNYAEQINAPWLDVIIGKTRYTAGEDTIYVEPVNTAPRNFTDVIAAS